jgi:RNA polymerase sigma-70 factor, ECF subfamily
LAESLSELLERVGRGEEPATADLVSRFGGSGQRLAEALLGSTHDAEEAVQEAFVTALARLGELRSPDAFPAWFRQIVRTSVGRVLRRRRLEAGGAELEAVSGRELRPDESIQVAELRERVRKALAELRRPDREAAELFYLDEQSVAEVAAALEVPIGTVKRRLHSARARLRNLLLGSYESPRPEAERRRDEEI